MTVKELKELLNNCNDDMKIFIKSSNSDYVDRIAGARVETINCFWSDSVDAVVIKGSEQEGRVL